MFLLVLTVSVFMFGRDFAHAYLNVEETVNLRTEDLSRANVALRAMEAMKAKFFANVSHDFKTPIAVAYANIEQAKGKANGEASEALGVAEGALNKLLGMVTDVLDGLKSEAGEMKFKWETIRPGQIFPVWSEPFRMLCEKKGLAFNIINDVGPNVSIPMDVARMERVLANLISNALKFTDTGSISVRISTTEKDLRIQILDTGPGIPKDERDKIFDRFYQGFNTTLRDHGGSGIGLSFVKEIVDLHHGRIWIDANEPTGSIFNVALPLSQEDIEITGEYTVDGRDFRMQPLKGSLDVPYPKIEPEKIDTHKPNVLVVEDNPDIAQIIFNSLRDEFNLFFAKHGQDALDLLNRTRVDGVLTDIMMPVMDGTELIKRLRTDERYMGLPIVVLSSKGEAEDVVQHLKLGAQDYVSKPFRKDVLVARLKAQIDRRILFERLLAADKMVTMGLLSAGVAHEIRNPLGQAMNGVMVLPNILSDIKEAMESPETKTPEDFLNAFREQESRMTRAVELAIKPLQRIHRLMDSMRGFASGSQQRVEINVSDVIDEAMTLVAGKAKKNQVSVSFENKGTVRVMGYSTIHQVFVNLLDNAIDATPEGVAGTIGINCVATEQGATVTVQDKGSGIEPAVIPHIFDPFVTTKDPNKGTGLGLFIVKRIVELQHGGKIGVQSVVGSGTTFTVDLPKEAPPMDIEGFKPFHG